jgi:hypothetical protein
MKKKVHKTGQWGMVGRVVQNLGMTMKQSSEIAMAKTALYAERKAVMHMKSQDLPWQGLKQSTLDAKANAGQSSKILMATSDYFQSITSFSNHSIAFAGVKRDAVNGDGDDLTSIAAVHEFGNSDIPERPLWRPVARETAVWMKKSKLFSRLALKKMKS